MILLAAVDALVYLHMSTYGNLPLLVIQLLSGDGIAEEHTQRAGLTDKSGPNSPEMQQMSCGTDTVCTA